jgi:small subunit ribosomal protein S24e
MKVEIIEKTENQLFKRTEVKFKADHAGEPTPKRLDVRAQLANQLGVAAELIVIEKLASTHGRQMASGIARAYSSREQLEGLEPKFLLQRGMPKEAKPEPEKPPEKAEKPKEEMKKPEKPKEEKVEKPKEKPKEEEVEAKEKPSKEADAGGKEG